MKSKNYIASFKYAITGIKSFYSSEIYAWVHSVIGLLVLVLSFFSDLNKMEWLWVILAIVLVIVAEMFNTAIEALADNISTEENELIKKAKDISAGATLVLSIFAVIVAILIILPKWI